MPAHRCLMPKAIFFHYARLFPSLLRSFFPVCLPLLYHVPFTDIRSHLHASRGQTSTRYSHFMGQFMVGKSDPPEPPLKGLRIKYGVRFWILSLSPQLWAPGYISKDLLCRKTKCLCVDNSHRTVHHPGLRFPAQYEPAAQDDRDTWEAKMVLLPIWITNASWRQVRWICPFVYRLMIPLLQKNKWISKREASWFIISSEYTGGPEQ